jgi:hypothetical protein
MDFFGITTTYANYWRGEQGTLHKDFIFPLMVDKPASVIRRRAHYKDFLKSTEIEDTLREIKSKRTREMSSFVYEREPGVPKSPKKTFGDIPVAVSKKCAIGILKFHSTNRNKNF